MPIKANHEFLENTIPSMVEAYELNADTIELDVHSTADGKEKLLSSMIGHWSAEPMDPE